MATASSVSLAQGTITPASTAATTIPPSVLASVRQDGFAKAYLQQLVLHPLRTKMATSGTLQAFQEYLASYLTNTKNANGGYFTDRVVKMSMYGAFVQAPLNHYLVGSLQDAFAGKVGLKWKVLQLIASNLLVVPTQVLVAIISMTIVRGAKTTDDVITAVKKGYWPMYKFVATISPCSLILAQNFLAPELWVPFFNLVAFVAGTALNVIAKRAAVAAANEKKAL